MTLLGEVSHSRETVRLQKACAVFELVLCASGVVFQI